MKRGLRTSDRIVVACLAALILGRAGGLCAAPLEGTPDIAPDRVEHKRAAADGKLPLPGTPDLAKLDERLAKRGLPSDASIMIRIFKAESELEIWMSRGGTGARYALFASYPVCYWSGTLGPKIREGDRQAPEGFYTVTLPQAYPNGQRHPQALNIGFPNSFDVLHARHGSYILIHGGCASIGCFAMTDSVNKEIRTLSLRALDSGQAYIPVHVFPFRMTDANLAHYDKPEVHDFWQNLKEGYDVFERTHSPPRISVCEARYAFDATGALEGANPGPIAVCPSTQALIDAMARINRLVAEQGGPLPVPAATKASLGTFPYRTSGVQEANLTSRGETFLRQIAPATLTPGVNAALTRPFACALALPSCRRYAALRERLASEAVVAQNDASDEKKKTRAVHHGQQHKRKHH
jgi:murein L,D-transpeptidase YafK